MRKSSYKTLILLLMVCMLLTLLPTTAMAGGTEGITLARSSFTDTDDLTLSGTAILDSTNSRLQLVSNNGHIVGGVFTTDKVSMGSDGFSLATQVYCGPSNTAADGFAIVLAKDTNECVLTSAGSSIGYANMTNSTAVQYLTYLNSYIALGTDGNQNLDSTIFPGFWAPNNSFVYFWIDYDAANTILKVYASTTNTRPVYAARIYTVDLSSYSNYYIGFTSATGDASQEYAVAQWYYDAAYHSDGLYLDGSITYSETVAAGAMVTKSASDITSSSARIRGVWGSDYDTGYTKGFEYKQGETGAVSVIDATDGTALLSALSMETAYCFRTYAYNTTTTEYTYGEWRTFTTLNRYTVTVTGGYIGENVETTTAAVDAGTSVTLTAPYVERKLFTGWQNAEGTVVSTENPYTFIVNTNTALTAVYIDTWEGTGTEANPYLITGEDDLVLLGTLVDSGHSFADQYFEVTQSFAITSADFNPIGSLTGNLPFCGNLNGNGHTISDLHLTATTSEFVGLFSLIDGATIQNLTISNASITGSNYGAGGITGYMGNDCNIISCTIANASITGGYVGAIVGYSNSANTIKDCTVTSGAFNGNYPTGGIAGFMEDNTDIIACSVADSSIAGSNAGGIIGNIDDYNSILSCSVANCTINGDYAGGIAGYADDCNTIGYCNVTGNTLTGSYLAGGIAAFMYYCPMVTNCIVSGGSITNNGTDGFAGGVIGLIYNDYYDAVISQCQVTCNISSSGTGCQHVGGIIAGGYTGNLAVENCEYNGDLTSESDDNLAYAGGIIGEIYIYDAASIENCVTYGTVSADNEDTAYAGGILGAAFYGDLTLTNNVAMQSTVTAAVDGGGTGYANSLYGYSEKDATVADNYSNAAIVLTSSETSGQAGGAKTLAEMDDGFWTDLGFTAANGWERTTTENVTSAPVEAHRSANSTATLTVTGNATPYFMGVAISANPDGAYTVYVGAKVTMKNNDPGYKITGLTVNGTSITEKPWTFTVTSATNVTVTLQESPGDFWVYDECYVRGNYDEDSDYNDIDWSDAVDSNDEPISGTYTDANIYVLDDNDLCIGQLNLNNGSVIGKTDGNEFELEGWDADSYLIADSIVAEAYSDDVYIEGLSVTVNSIWIYDELDIRDNSDVTTDTLTIKDNCCGVEIYNDSSLMVGAFYAAVDFDDNDDECIYVGDNSILTADTIIGTLGLYAEEEADITVRNGMETDYIRMVSNSTATITGNVAINEASNYHEISLYDTAVLAIDGDVTLADGTVELFNSATLDVTGTITSETGVHINSLNAVLLNAEEESTIPYYSAGNEDAYIRTTLTGLPVNTRMTFATDGAYQMEFTARTNSDGTLVAWLLPSTGAVTATTVDDIAYASTDTIGNATATVAMSHSDQIIAVNVSASVDASQESGAALSYSEVNAVADDPSFVFNQDKLTVTLTDKKNQNIELDSPLPNGIYYLTITYEEKDLSDNTIAYGTTTYVVTMGSSYTITATANANGSISPSGSIIVVENSSSTFTIKPNVGYAVADVLVDGVSVGAVKEYTFTHIKANHSIEASFVDDSQYKHFDDVNPNQWYAEAIDYVVRAKLFQGVSETTFAPNDSMSRAMLVTVLYRLEGYPATTGTDPFTDVAAGKWYTDAVIWASEAGIINGYNAKSFGPSDPITREQMATILYRYAVYKGYDITATNDLKAFSDAKNVSDWALQSMKWAVGEGLIVGRTPTRLVPGGDATRAQCATILMRFVENVVN